MAYSLVPRVRLGTGTWPLVTPLERERAARAEELFRNLVGRRTGVIRQVTSIPTLPGDAPLFHAGAQIANAHPYYGEHLGLGVGGGGLSREQALIAALCEGVERYAASSYAPDKLGLRPRRALGAERSIDPQDLLRFTERQRAAPDFPLSPVNQDTPLRWVKGWDIASGEAIWVPAFAVYLPYMLEPSEPLVAMGLSTGLACGRTLEEAICRGICEAVERDAIALLWIRGLTPPRLDPALVKHQVGHLLPPRDEVAVFDLTTTVGLHVFMVIAQGSGPRGSLLSVGAACHADAGAALRKAAVEAGQDRVFVRMLLDRDPDWKPARDFSNVTDFTLHARLYSSREALAERGLEFLRGGPITSPPALVQAEPIASPDGFEGAARLQLRPLVAALNHAGLSVAAVDLSPAWAIPLGLHVVRTVIPELLPLHGNHALRCLDHPRLAKWASAMPGATLTHDRPFWPYPHPMP